MRSSTSLAAAAALLLSACAPDLRVDYPFDGTAPDDGASHFTFEELGGGVTRTEADATHKEFFVYLDLDGKKELPGADALGTRDWDLGFQRFKIITNSGVSGVGDVEAAVLSGADFDGLAQAPIAGYTHDEPGGTDPQSAFIAGDGWYAYDLLAHKVLPRSNVYVVHTPRGFYKLKILAYYDQAGTGAKISFDWAPVAPPAP